jgi:peptide/nickel transport system substrate-binding protein
MCAPYRSHTLSPRAVALGAVLTVTASLVGWYGTSAATLKDTSASTPSGGVHLVTTTPAPKGGLSSITWDLPKGEPTTLDYVKAGDYSPDILVSNLCTDLLRLTPSWQYKPGLAKSWKYTNAEKTTLVLTIQHGVHFWNGQELTSADVAYSMLRNMTSKDTPVNGTFYKLVKSITATGPFQVTVHFTKPDELFIKEMATVAGAIAEKSFIEAKGSSYGTAAGGVMCSGPYELTKWNAGNDIVLKANPDYWTPAYRPKIKTITVKFISTSSTLTSELLSGEITGAYQIPSTSYPELKTTSNGKLYFGPSLEVLEMQSTTTTGLLANVKLRDALSLAINRSAIASVVFAGAATPNKTLTPETAWTPTARSIYAAAYARLPSLQPNLAEAKALVKSVPNHSATITLGLLAGTQEDVEAATAIQQSAQSIGLNMKLDELQPLAYSNAFYLPQYRKGISSILAQGYLDIPDPLDYLDLFIGKKAIFNWTDFDNATVTKDVSQAYSSFTNAARARLITEAQALYTKGQIVIPLLNPDEGLFLNKRITGAPASFAYIYEPCLAKLGASK